VSTLHALPAYLLAPPEKALHYSGNRKIGLLVLDSASAYFWQERMSAEVAGLARDDDDDFEALQGRFPPHNIAEEPSPRNDDREAKHANAQEDKDIAAALRATQALFGCPVVYTTITLSNSNASTTSTSANDSIPLQNSLAAPLSPLPTSFPTLRLLCSRNAVKRFPANMGVSALLQDRGARQAVVEKGAFRVDVVPGGSVWGRDEGLRERLRMCGREARGFGVEIGSGGVVVE